MTDDIIDQLLNQTEYSNRRGSQNEPTVLGCEYQSKKHSRPLTLKIELMSLSLGHEENELKNRIIT